MWGRVVGALVVESVRGCGEASICRDVILEDCRMLLLWGGLFELELWHSRF